MLDELHLGAAFLCLFALRRPEEAPQVALLVWAKRGPRPDARFALANPAAVFVAALRGCSPPPFCALPRLGSEFYASSTRAR